METHKKVVHPQDAPVTRTVEVCGLDRKLEKAVGLQWVATRTPGVIPRRLLEHTFRRTFDTKTIDRMYQYADQIAVAPTCFLFLLIEPAQHEIHGVLWLKLDPIEQTLCVYLFAVDPEYDDGRWIGRLLEWLYRQPFPWDSLQPEIRWLVEDAQDFQPDKVQRVVMGKGTHE